APGSYSQSPGAGYDGLTLDIRCREAGKTHLDCPEYLRTFQGRDAAGFENYEQYRPRGVRSAPGPSVPTPMRDLGLPIGDNSVNAGGPSTTMMDDGPEVSFDREFLGNPVIVQGDPGRLRDIFAEPDEDETRLDLEDLFRPDEDDLIELKPDE
ncbi:MAG: hypothetical protein WBA35_08435, partial [Litorimonas sp.]